MKRNTLKTLFHFFNFTKIKIIFSCVDIHCIFSLCSHYKYNDIFTTWTASTFMSLCILQIILCPIKFYPCLTNGKNTQGKLNIQLRETNLGILIPDQMLLKTFFNNERSLRNYLGSHFTELNKLIPLTF